MAYINGKKVLQVVKTQYVPAVYQEKTITPLNQTREITADSNYAALSKVILDGLLVDPHQSYTTSNDTTTAYQKTVPAGALKYASLDSLGSMSYKCYQLFDNNNIALVGKTFSGANQTPYSYSGFAMKVFNLVIGTTYTISSTKDMRLGFTDDINNSGTYQQTNSYTFTASTTYLLITNRIANEYNEMFENLMLNQGSTALPYEPYYDGIRDSAVTSVKSYGANLINASDNTILNAGFILPNTVLPNDLVLGTYTISFNYTGGGALAIQCFNSSDNQVGTNTIAGIVGTNTITFTTTDTTHYVRVYTNNSSGGTISNVMLVKGSTALAYKEYKGLIDTFTIPAEVQALTGYGVGLTSYPNVVDFESKKYTQKSYKENISQKVLDAIDTLTFRATSGGYEIGLDGGWLLETINGIITNPFEITNSSNVYNNTNNYLISNSWLSLPSTYDTKQKYIDYLTTNTIWAVVQKSTPVETDISQYIDNNFIEVEGSGTLIFNNTYEQAVPSEVTYLVEV